MAVKKISVTIKILILFILIAIITIGFSLFIGTPLIEKIGQTATIKSTELGDKAVRDSSSALLASAKQELFSLASDKAEITNLFFIKNGGDLEFLAKTAKQQMQQPVTNAGPIYTKEIIPPDPMRAGLLHSAPNATHNETSKEALLLTEMNRYCIPLYETNPDIDSIFIGTDTGMIQVYPWTDTLPKTYDPRLRPWYMLAQKSGNASWTNPYIDSSSKQLMMTCAIPVQSVDGANNWVIGIDVLVKTINDLITSTDANGEGYAFLIDNNGTIIVRPGLSSEDTRWDESYNTENLLISDSEEIRRVAEKMVQGESGVENVAMEEGDRIIAYAPINSTGWSIGIVRPLSSILAPVQKTEDLIRNETEATATDISKSKQEMLSIYLIGLLILLVIVILLAVFFARYITKPIGVLIEATRVIGRGDLDKEVRLHTGDEFEELGDQFNHMAQNLVHVMKSLERTTAEKERYATELDIAREIQESFLPETIPQVTGFDIAAESIMAREVGGDFFDIFPFEVVKVSSNKLILMIADVSGKGVPAALFMALARIVIRVNASWYDLPVEVINAANNIIARESRSGMFVTTFYADYLEESHLFRYVNAGHNPPILLRNGTITKLEGTGPAIGVLTDLEYDSGEVELIPGDLLVLYTDGVTEAINNDMTLFGEERLIDLLLQSSGSSAKDILTIIHNAVDTFAEGRPQEDDITLMIIKVK